VRLGFYRYRIRVQPNGVGTTPATDAGLPGLNTGTPETSGMPAFYIGGDGGFNFGYALGINQCNCPLKETENHFQIVNNWTKQIGNHSLKWGADLRRAQQQRIPSDSHRSGEISFDASITGSADVDNFDGFSVGTGSGIGSFLIGQPSFFARYFTGAGFHPGLRQSRLFFFGQDSWRATPRLTINYGLRWEDYLPQTAAKPGGAGSFDPTTGEVLAAGIGSVPSNMGVQAFNLGFAPRVGVSYQFLKSSVVRAGVGRSFNPSGLGAVFGQGADYNPPVTNPQNVSSVNSYVPRFSLLDGPPPVPHPPVGTTGRYPLPEGISVYYYTYPADSYRIPDAYFWNLAVETQFTSTLAFELAYVGNVGRHLFLSINENQAVPGPGDFDPRRPFFQKFHLPQALYQTCNCDTSQYNALQSKLQKRFSHGLDFLLTYTWSKAMDNSEGGGGFSDNYNIRASHGPASWDRTNEVTFDHNWDLPFGRDRQWKLGGNAIVDAIAGGWRLSGTHNFGSGLPFTPTVGDTASVNADLNFVTADVIGDPIVANPNRDQWFNPSAFRLPAQPYRNGTAHRNSLRGPKLAISNLSISKNLLPIEGKSLEFRAEAFNVFNHVNLGLPDSTIDDLGAGQITYVQAPMRQMQFALHLRF
jgi:TonB dependent receptor